MPTDVNNLKDQQTVCVRASVFGEVQEERGLVNVKLAGIGVFTIPRADIITNWPPEPSADEVRWKDVFPAEYENQSERYEYRVQRRPIAPKWVPTVGEEAMWQGSALTILAIDGGRAWVRDKKGYRYDAPVLSLTQPKEGGQ